MAIGLVIVTAAVVLQCELKSCLDLKKGGSLLLRSPVAGHDQGNLRLIVANDSNTNASKDMSSTASVLSMMSRGANKHLERPLLAVVSTSTPEAQECKTNEDVLSPALNVTQGPCCKSLF